MRRTDMKMATGLAVAMLATAALGWPLTGLAAPDQPEVTSALTGHPGVTYLSLLRQAIADLSYNAADKQVEGHLKSLRHIMGETAGGDPPDPVVVGFIEVRHIKAGGRPRLVVLADLGQAQDSAQSTTLMASTTTHRGRSCSMLSMSASTRTPASTTSRRRSRSDRATTHSSPTASTPTPTRAIRPASSSSCGATACG